MSPLSLLNYKFTKRRFDTSNKEDLKEFKRFLTTGSWGHMGCPFELEWPWLTVPDMISNKIARSAVDNI